MRSEKKIAKIINKGFSVSEWQEFPKEIKENEMILIELSKKLSKYDNGTISEIAKENPYIIKYLSKETQFAIVNNDNFRYLAEDLQLEIIDKNNNKIKYADDEVQIKYATSHPKKTSYLKVSLQKKLIDNNNYYLEYAAEDIQIEYARNDQSKLFYCSNLVQCKFIKQNPNYYVNCNKEVKHDIVVLKNLDPTKIKTDTLEAYLSCHYDNISLKELEEFKESMSKTNREDRDEMINYINYLYVNVEKKKL